MHRPAFKPAALVAGVLCLLSSGAALALDEPLVARPVPLAPAASGTFSVSFEGSSVLLADATVGGDVTLFGMAQETLRYLHRQTRVLEILRDDDGDGALVHELVRPVSRLSVWAAIDHASGAVAVAVPPGRTVREIPISRARLRADGDSIDLLDLRTAEVALVRRDRAAWGLRVTDGGPQDFGGPASRRDGLIRAFTDAFWEVGNGPPPPPVLVPGDVLVVIEPDDLEILVIRVEAREGSEP